MGQLCGGNAYENEWTKDKHADEKEENRVKERDIARKELIHHKVTKDTKTTENQDRKTGRRGFCLSRCS